jgi:hypothetical protein
MVKPGPAIQIMREVAGTWGTNCGGPVSQAAELQAVVTSLMHPEPERPRFGAIVALTGG